MFFNTRACTDVCVCMLHFIARVQQKISFAVFPLVLRCCVIKTKGIKVYELENHKLLMPFVYFTLSLSHLLDSLLFSALFSNFAAICSFEQIPKKMNSTQLNDKCACVFYSHQMQKHFSPTCDRSTTSLLFCQLIFAFFFISTYFYSVFVFFSLSLI